MANSKLIKNILESNTSPEEFLWLSTVISSGLENEKLLQTAFVAVPKHINKSIISIDPELELEKQFLSFMHFSPQGWSVQQLARVFIILHFNNENDEKYTNSLNTLFETAEINELSALLASLPLLSYPKNFLHHAKEAVRSNMGSVFNSIAFNNPYPSQHFDDSAWNQLVLKTIFSGKNIQQIYGLKGRSNRELAFIISDFAHERWAAGRPISPQVWELVAPFLDNQLINDIEKLFLSENEKEQQAAKLSCMISDFPEAKDLLKKYNKNLAIEKMEWADL